jgi:hypothetical protein
MFEFYMRQMARSMADWADRVAAAPDVSVSTRVDAEKFAAVAHRAAGDRVH